jgi:NADH-ubiquinone oxidoreductase chain 1
MTEHAAVIFVFFFLAEYGSILLICILISILFLGGYLIPDTLIYIIYILNYIKTYLFIFDIDLTNQLTLIDEFKMEYLQPNSILNSILCSLVLGLKTSMMVFTFI